MDFYLTLSYCDRPDARHYRELQQFFWILLQSKGFRSQMFGPRLHRILQYLYLEIYSKHNTGIKEMI